MKRSKCQLIFVMLAFFILFENPVFAGISVIYRIYINDERLNSDIPPYAIDDITFVPLRVVSERLGATVIWENPNVILIKGDTRIQLTVNQQTALVNETKITLAQAPFLDYKRFTVKETEHSFTVIQNPKSDPNVVMVPLRFISEAFGATVDFDGVNINITQ